MAVNITEIGTVYNALETKVNNTLTTMFESYNITAEGKAQVLSNAIATMLQLSVSSTQQQETITKDIDIKERQMDIAEANSVKDLLFKDSQKLILDQQKLTEIQRTSQLVQSISESTEKQAYNVANTQKQGILLDGQASKLTADIALVSAQKDTEGEKKLLTARQKDSYNDNLRIEEAKSASNVVGMAWAGGTIVDSTAIATMWSKIDAIAP